MIVRVINSLKAVPQARQQQPTATMRRRLKCGTSLVILIAVLWMASLVGGVNSASIRKSRTAHSRETLVEMLSQDKERKL